MSPRSVDLSHEIVDGMTTHPGIPAPSISTFLSFEASEGRYAPGTTFQIGRIDWSPIPARTSTRPRIGSRAGRTWPTWPSSASWTCRASWWTPRREARAIGPDVFDDVAVAGQAVLVRTGWDANWGTPAYLADHPFLTASAADYLVGAGAALVGIDSLNVDSLEDPSRPAHTAILGANVPLVEHLTGLDGLPTSGLPVLRGAAPHPGHGDVPDPGVRPDRRA